METIDIRCLLDDGQVEAELTVGASTTFLQYLEMLGSVFEGQFSFFTYEDDHGDRCRVSSDDDVQQMVQWWYHIRELMPEPVLTIHAATEQALATPQMNLTVDVRQMAHDGMQSPPTQYPSPMIDASPSGHAEIQPEQLVDYEFLGHGSAGTVYRATHVQSGTPMAVKVIAIDTTQEVQNQIRQELDILHRCHSGTIIDYYGVFFAENRIHICTEFMNGGSLDRYAIIPEQVLGVILGEVLAGLDYLITLKIMHRDVKPSNILINTRGQIKLCDFGVSRQLEKSVTATYVGTNAYMAPERVLHRPYDARSDVWSLGITAYELASGQQPYAQLGARSAIELLQCIVHEAQPSLDPEAFSAELQDFVSRCLVKEVDQRPFPDALRSHAFVLMYAGKIEIVLAWVAQMLQAAGNENGQ
eukprot:TRINITY_DN1122_c0_g1_i1.p1 TRINITY_DN1122_c0_g1~~TRINITY_DN1122_c0_g1_i1.p1  ORF type:complete len:415 (+),score=90.63 TRINITY_DN1122_c0_g1_i1:133-1377(+)